ncbi:uncharacterized protein LOC129048484 [Pongo abelii]|uniref:uncharacterized protein LOC129048484 n=1 Tax=Pongo abelii TaxID=9601 RepID=UPI0030072F25
MKSKQVSPEAEGLLAVAAQGSRGGSCFLCVGAQARHLPGLRRSRRQSSICGNETGFCSQRSWDSKPTAPPAQPQFPRLYKAEGAGGSQKLFLRSRPSAVLSPPDTPETPQMAPAAPATSLCPSQHSIQRSGVSRRVHPGACPGDTSLSLGSPGRGSGRSAAPLGGSGQQEAARAPELRWWGWVSYVWRRRGGEKYLRKEGHVGTILSACEHHTGKKLALNLGFWSISYGLHPPGKQAYVIYGRQFCKRGSELEAQRVSETSCPLGPLLAPCWCPNVQGCKAQGTLRGHTWKCSFNGPRDESEERVRGAVQMPPSHRGSISSPCVLNQAPGEPVILRHSPPEPLVATRTVPELLSLSVNTVLILHCTPGSRHQLSLPPLL